MDPAFEAVWRQLPIPGEFDGMDDCDQERWRGVVEMAYRAGLAAADQSKSEDGHGPVGSV